ncbi:DUF3516 domain-containing protein [Collinsella sp. AGMB00827]|uniref:DUF3516 domain-containing protein n=1 Tax=Collinsella ureilytica TaxID=2869515 RepID=A0ABS7MPJ2_9ACTN|nr:DUF3516 domain-containing protein [Collinsella urealyticum]MBY4798290.1 DUF3516 domain-containing protein [Collinsella urealyticum]
MIEITDPFAHGSLGKLAPSWWENEDGSANEPWLSAEAAYGRFLAWVEARAIELWPHQEEALFALASGTHVILGTPTGSGKSLVAIGQLFIAMASGMRGYYTAPIKALVSEKFFALAEIFGRENVGMITGDSRINSSAPIICCTAEILANQALREGEATDVGTVAMDEFHFFSDPDRGWAWQVPLLTLPHAQFMLMSATLGDMSAIAAALTRETHREVELVIDAPRPVPLSFEYVKTGLEATVELALRQGDSPIYIVHFAQDAALASARALASYGVSEKPQREAIKDALKGERFTTAFGKTLRHLLGVGVGLHHAGLLPRYRLLVEKLAQQGLLPVICGTDTLGVGINVPIHTVLLTGLTKFDGHRQRRLRSREFHQIAGRAGRMGFDTEGMVIAEAPAYEIENYKAELKADGDPKKLRRLKRKRAPEGFVGWDEQTFTRLIEAEPETLKPRLRITHSMVLSLVERGGDAWNRICTLIDSSLQTDEQKTRLKVRAAEIFATLIDAGVVVREAAEVCEPGSPLDGAASKGEDEHETFSLTPEPASYALTIDLPEDFALDQPLSPFLLAALELLDLESESYDLDLISFVEATLEDPRQILRAQEKRAKNAAMAEMKADGIEYEERIERLEEINYPRPMEEELSAAYATYCEQVPWAGDYQLSPKSVLRDMLETGCDFKSYIALYKVERAEGILLRYLTEAYRALDRTVPVERRTERLEEIVSWLGLVVRSVDSSLVDEWARLGTPADTIAPPTADAVVQDRRGLTLLVRNALFLRVRLAAQKRLEELGELDRDWGFGIARWRSVLDSFFAEHEELLLDADARSTAFFSLDESDEQKGIWHVHQIFADVEGDRDFGIMADVDLKATQESDGVVFSNYRVGDIESLLED